MTHLLASPLFQALGWTLLHSLWQGALLGILAWGGLRALRRRSAGARYALAGLALAALPLVAGATFLLCWPEPVPQGGAFLTGPAALPAKGWRELLEPALPYAATFWMAGVCIMGLRLAGGWVWLQRLRRKGTEPVAEVWNRRARVLCERLGIQRPVRLLTSWIVDAPMVIGWLRPVILVPAAALAHMDPAALEAILAHELEHIRRQDYLVNLLQSLVEALFFYHPAAWWLSRQIRAEREHCCDDAAVSCCGDPILYARALASLEDLRHSLEPDPGLAVAASGGILMNRIKRLILPNLPPSSAGRAGLFALLTVTALGAATGLGFAQEKPAPNAPEAPKAAPEKKEIRKTIRIERKFDGEGHSKALDAKTKAFEAKVKAFVDRTLETRKGAKADPELERLKKELQDAAKEMATEIRKEIRVEVHGPHMRIEESDIDIPDLPGTATEREVILAPEAPGEAAQGHRRIIIKRLPGKGGSEVDELKAELARLKARLDRLEPMAPTPPPAPPAPPAAPAPPPPPAPPAPPSAE